MLISDAALHDHGAGAYCAYGSRITPEIVYLSGFRTSDPVIYIRREEEPGFIIVSQMEYERAMREASCQVMTRNEAGLIRIIEEGCDHWESLAKMITGLTNGPVLIPELFPYALGHALLERVPVIVDREIVSGLRAVKSETELNSITLAQRAAEEAVDTAINLIKNSKPHNGGLYLNDAPLTSGMVKSAMHKVLLDRGCNACDTIVVSGPDSALPHMMGNGPLLSDSPIVIDIFPQDDATGYYADMTRTVVHGEPAPEITEMWHAVKDAASKAMNLAKAGVTGSEVHSVVVDSFREVGYPSGKEGFTHNTGHGIGLEVHEPPTVGPSGGVLSSGNVITIEPGLYFNSVGGVRLENMGLITADGFINITRYPEELIL